jgi:hypothetical protein
LPATAQVGKTGALRIRQQLPLGQWPAAEDENR